MITAIETTRNASRPSPSSTITRWMAVAGNDLEANTTRLSAHRCVSSTTCCTAPIISVGSEAGALGMETP